MFKLRTSKIRHRILTGWLLFLLASGYFYFFQRDMVLGQVSGAFTSSVLVGCLIYLVLGCLRGFTLIPITYLIVLGIVFLPPVPLYILTVVSAVVSSACVYYFSEYLHLSEFFEQKHAKRIAQVTSVLQKNELPIIAAWSFMPFLPTDVICYVCGTLEVDVRKFLLGIFIGEGVACGIYIFLGEKALPFFHLLNG